MRWEEEHFPFKKSSQGRLQGKTFPLRLGENEGCKETQVIKIYF